MSETDRKDREEPIGQLVQNPTNSILRLPRKLANQVAETAEKYQGKGKGEGVTVAAGRHRSGVGERERKRACPKEKYPP